MDLITLKVQFIHIFRIVGFWKYRCPCQMRKTTGRDDVALVLKMHQLQIKHWTHYDAAFWTYFHDQSWANVLQGHIQKPFPWVFLIAWVVALKGGREWKNERKQSACHASSTQVCWADQVWVAGQDGLEAAGCGALCLLLLLHIRMGRNQPGNLAYHATTQILPGVACQSQKSYLLPANKL